MAKVTLINPPLTTEERYRKLSKVGSVLPPLGLCSIASVLEKEGHDVNILDGQFIDESEILKKSLNSDIVCMGGPAMAYPKIVSLAEKIKQQNRDIKVIVGGNHMTAVPTLAIKSRFIDFGVVGEAEITMAELVKAIESDKPTKKIKGIAYTKGEKIMMTKQRELIKDLDELPMPARHLLPPLHLYKPNAQNYKRLPSTSMISSRGCTFNCSFCDHSLFGRTFRSHSPERVVEEMEMLKEKYRINEVWFVDDTFTLNKKRVLEICRLIKEKKLDMSWNCLSRVDTIDKSLLKSMKESGCWLINYGIDSGNQKVLCDVNKRATLQQAKNAIQWTKEANMESKGFFIIGLPTDTEETIDDTIEFAKELPLDHALFTIFVPLPNTQIYKEVYAAKECEEDWSKFNLMTPVHKHPNLSDEFLKKSIKRAYQEFYFRPSYIGKQILKTRSISDFKRKIQGFLSLISI